MSTRELAVLPALLTKALLQVRQSKAGRVKAVRLALGEIAELDPQVIQELWQELSRGTPLEQAQLHFRFIDAEVQCMACFMKYHPLDGKIHCPHCGSYGAKVLSGEEFHLESIEWDDH